MGTNERLEGGGEKEKLGACFGWPVLAGSGAERLSKKILRIGMSSLRIGISSENLHA